MELIQHYIWFSKKIDLKRCDNMPEISEVPDEEGEKFERISSHTHIQGLGLDESGGAQEVQDGMVGQKKAREAAGRVVSLVKKGKLGGRSVLLAGPPGTGKTAVAVGMARELGEDVPFIQISGSQIFSAERDKTDILMESLRKALGVRVSEMRDVYEGEVKSLDIESGQSTYNPYQQSASEARISLKTEDEDKTLRLGKSVASSLQNKQVSEGDVIQIENGIYSGTGNTNVELLGKAITITSVNGREYCTIDCGGEHQAFYVHEGETPATQIRDLTISNGYSDSTGGAIYINTASLRIDGCAFENCFALIGGAIGNRGLNTEILGCIFTHNTAGQYAGAIHAFTHTQIIGCRFTLNDAAGPVDGNGGAIVITDTGEIFNCLFEVNTAERLGGAVYIESSAPITNCTFDGNSALISGDAVYIEGPNTIPIKNSIFYMNGTEHIGYETTAPTVTYSNVYMTSGVYPGTGNINADPEFISLAGDLYYLSHTSAGQGSTSPCVDAGADPASVTCNGGGNICIDFFTTRTDLFGDGGQADMGYHYPTDLPAPTATPDPTATPTATPIPDPCAPSQTATTEIEDDLELWPLNGWTIPNIGTPGYWNINVDVGAPNYAGGDGNCLVAGDMYAGGSVTTTCMSPGFSLLDADNAVLDFYASYDDGAFQSDFFRVQFSGTGGGTYQTILEWDEDHSPDGPGEFVRLDLSDYAGLYDDCVIRFLYFSSGGNNSRIMIDQIIVTLCEGDDCINNGDSNLDGSYTAGDAQLAFQMVLGIYTPTYEESCAADCNGDGSLTAADAQAIFLKVLGASGCADDRL